MTIKHIYYFAGIIDGEGCFSISKFKNGYRLVLSVSNTSLVLIHWLYNSFGGLIYQRKSYNDKWKTRYEWIIPMYKIDNILVVLKNCLIVKNPQLKVAIKFRSTFKKGKFRKLTPEILSIREKCRIEMKELNKKGNLSVTTIHPPRKGRHSLSLWEKEP